MAIEEETKGLFEIEEDEEEEEEYERSVDKLIDDVYAGVEDLDEDLLEDAASSPYASVAGQTYPGEGYVEFEEWMLDQIELSPKRYARIKGGASPTKKEKERAIEAYRENERINGTRLLTVWEVVDSDGRSIFIPVVTGEGGLVLSVGRPTTTLEEETGPDTSDWTILKEAGRGLINWHLMFFGRDTSDWTILKDDDEEEEPSK